jgi:hypothetical protein
VSRTGCSSPRAGTPTNVERVARPVKVRPSPRLAIDERFANDFDSALALSAVLVAVSAALLLSIKLVTGMTWLGAAR